MVQNNEIKNQSKSATARPKVTSYDSGYEHSIEHWMELRLLVAESEAEITVVEETRELVLA